MRAEFWEQAWADGRTGFDQAAPHPMLVSHFAELGVEGGRVFVPLCGRSRDVGWLLEAGYSVVGVELVESAVANLFSGLGRVPKIETVGAFRRYVAGNLTVWVGDVFDLTRDKLGAVAAVYDRAALVAFPPDIRARYVRHVVAITDHAPQLLVTIVFEGTEPKGPPFSVPEAVVRESYAGFTVSACAREPIRLERGMAHITGWRLQ